MPGKTSKPEALTLAPPEDWFGKHVSTMDTGHHIYKLRHETPGHPIDTYHAWNPKTKKVDVKVSGDQRDHFLEVSGLYSYKDSKVKAHKFLAHIIKHHDLNLMSDATQTYGARKVWKLLGCEPGIETKGYNKKGQKELKTKRVYQVHNQNKPNSERANYVGNYHRMIARKK